MLLLTVLVLYTNFALPRKLKFKHATPKSYTVSLLCEILIILWKTLSAGFLKLHRNYTSGTVENKSEELNST